MRGRFFISIMMAISALFVTPADACRYTVRDVAFVDLERSGFQLFAFVNASTDADWKNNFNVMSTATFVDTNVEAAMIDVNAEPSHEAIDFLKAAQPRGETKLPALVLVSPAGDVLNLPAESNTWDGMASLIQSPARKAIMSSIYESYAVVLLIEGTDKAANQLARQSIEGAFKQIDSIRHEMPKPVKVGPKLVSIKSVDRVKERVLLWSYGVEVELSADPSVVVVLGRGRKIGPVQSGPAILQTDVFEILQVIGQDCECNLDRKWMQGRSFPFTFGVDYVNAVKRHVGFDPRDDAVIAEMNRILSRGPVPAADLATGIPRTAGPAEGLLGYREMTVGEANEDAVSLDKSDSMIASAAKSNSGTGSPAVTPPDAGGSVWRNVFIVVGLCFIVAIVGTVIVRRRAVPSSGVS